MDLDPKDLLSLALALLVGSLLGIEREIRDKAAGLRTTIFICVGATLFTIFSRELAGGYDPTRISANIVVGVGFLGAGVILRQSGRITGLTTAALIWFTAALGLGLGGGRYGVVGAATGLGLLVLWVFPRLESWLGNFRQDRDYEIVYVSTPQLLAELETFFRENGLRLFAQREMKRDGEIHVAWKASGSLAAHRRVQARLGADPNVREFRF